jgi:hypothetical protein
VRYVGQLGDGRPWQGVPDEQSEQAPVKARNEVEVRPPDELAQANCLVCSHRSDA